MDSAINMATRDEFAKFTGMEIVEVGAGRAVTEMMITGRHMNGLGIVHGGAVFTLADLAFAAACNSHGYDAVAINATISYLKAATSGKLRAEATEVATNGKMGTYAVRVMDGEGEVIAVFQGLSYRKGASAKK